MANQGGRYEVKGDKKVLTQRTGWKPKSSAKSKSTEKEVTSDAVPEKVHTSKN